jgi:hypothetical protein
VNKQLYENSGLRELFADSEQGNGDSTVDPARPFFNSREPNLAIMHEKPEHRVLLMLKAQGLSNREIAKQTGYTEPWMSQLFRQPWAQRALSEFITNAGLDEVTQLLKGAAADSVRKLIDIRDNPLAPVAVVRATCVDLLDRFMGKPAQHVHVEQSPIMTTNDVAEIDKKIEELNAETHRLVGAL